MRHHENHRMGFFNFSILFKQRNKSPNHSAEEFFSIAYQISEASSRAKPFFFLLVE